jgi:hypothetical protein
MAVETSRKIDEGFIARQGLGSNETPKGNYILQTNENPIARAQRVFKEQLDKRDSSSDLAARYDDLARVVNRSPIDYRRKLELLYTYAALGIERSKKDKDFTSWAYFVDCHNANKILHMRENSYKRNGLLNAKKR